MTEENKVVNQTQDAQKDFTKKNKYDKKVEKDSKEVKNAKEVKSEKADLNFNSVSTASTASINTSTSSDSTIFDSTQKVTVPESKPVTVEVKSDPITVKVPTTIKAKVNGKVISVSNLSYIVKTKDGNGVLVIGEHNKKIGDII